MIKLESKMGLMLESDAYDYKLKKSEFVFYCLDLLFTLKRERH